MIIVSNIQIYEAFINIFVAVYILRSLEIHSST